jgi:Transmembrane domain of unknown function (DUF3566)
MSASDPSVRAVPGFGDTSLRDARTGTANRAGSPDGPPTGPIPSIRPSGSRPSGARPAFVRPAGSVSNRAPRPARPDRAPRPVGGARKARLSLARIDPWGVLKLSFLLSVALGIIYVIAVAILWKVVDGMGVFTDINNLVHDVDTANADFNILDFVGFERILSLATVIAVADVLLLTVLSTLFAFLYNLGSALVGGIRVTLTDD